MENYEIDTYRCIIFKNVQDKYLCGVHSKILSDHSDICLARSVPVHISTPYVCKRNNAKTRYQSN